MNKSLEFQYELDTDQWICGSINYSSEDDWDFECVYLVSDPTKPWNDFGVNITEYYDLYTFNGKNFKDLIITEAYEVIADHERYAAEDYADYRRDRQSEDWF